jgi:hypothetical protein
MGFFSPLSGLVKGIKKVTGKIDKGVKGVVNKLPGGKTINKVMGALPGPGHTVIGDAIAKRKAKLPPVPGAAKPLPAVSEISNLSNTSDIRPAGQINLPRGNKFKF